MARHLNTIFPIAALVDKLFGKSKEEFRKELRSNGAKEILVPENFTLSEDEIIKTDLELENNNILSNLIPGAIEIPLETLIKSGFSIKCYLKNDTEHCVDNKKEAGILIFNIQHEDPNKSRMLDGYSIEFDPISEIEITTLNSAILLDEKPELFGNKFKIEEAMKHASIKIRDIVLERQEARNIMLAKLEEYNKNPEKREKDTKKAFENLKFKFNSLKNKDNADKSQEFTKGALQILGSICGMNNLKSFDELKNIPIFKKEIEAGGSFADLLIKFSDMASKLTKTEE